MKQKHLFLVIVLMILLINISACSPKPKLSIEEHPIKNIDWECEDLTFEPIEGTREDILAKRKFERMKPAQTFSRPAEIGNHTIRVTEGFGEDYDAAENLTKAYTWLDVYEDDLLVMTIDTGVISPINNFRGLWVYESHWFLEVAHVEENPVDTNAAFVMWGEILYDGKSLNERYDYEEAFNFQLLNNKPFFFFKEDGEYGFSYDGKEAKLGYSEIPHYLCCSASAFNPLAAENMVAFYASTGEQDYYVEIGNFE
jgi:hypothetical protein